MAKATALKRTHRTDRRTERVSVSASDDNRPAPIIAPGTLGEQLLYSREQAQHLLGDVSLATIKRMEESGRLHPIRPTGSPTGKVYYTSKNLIEVASGNAGADRA